jgi:small GTP-binding protein
MADEEEYEMMAKVILIGDSSVGKTNIMSKYLKNQFNENSKATVGVEFGSKLFKLNGHNIKAQIWDTAGQEKYMSINKNKYTKKEKWTMMIIMKY